MSTVQQALAGIEFDRQVSDGDLVADVTILMRMVRVDDGQESLIITGNTGYSGIMQMGMLETALAFIRQEGYRPVDDE